MNNTKMYRLYAKMPDQKRYQPVYWKGGYQVKNVLYATIFYAHEIEALKRELDLLENKHISFKIKEIK